MTPASFLPVSVVEPLLAKLNNSRDFYLFVKEMRLAFKMEIAVEKMTDKERRDREASLLRKN